MLFSKTPTNRGFINMIILLIIVLLVLSYFGYNLRSIINSPNTQDNFSYVGGSIVDIWNNYLKVPATYAYNLFIDLIWNPAITNLTAIKNNQPTNIQQLTPMLPTYSAH